MSEMKPPNAMEFLVANPAQLTSLKPGESVAASVRKQGRDFVLDDLKVIPAPAGKN
jgi:Cu/Ag efflux protein CusF